MSARKQRQEKRRARSGRDSGRWALALAIAGLAALVVASAWHFTRVSALRDTVAAHDAWGGALRRLAQGVAQGAAPDAGRMGDLAGAVRGGGGAERVEHAVNDALSATMAVSRNGDPAVAQMLLERASAAVAEDRALAGAELDGAWATSFALLAALVGLAVCVTSLVASTRREFSRTSAALARLRAKVDSIDEGRRDAECESEWRGRVIRTISQELRVPLNGVLGAAQLLERSELGSRQREYLETLTLASDKMRRLLDDVVDLARAEGGRIELESEYVQLRGLVDEALVLAGHDAAGRGIELVSVVAPDVPDQMRGDAGRLRQILVNLLSNAVRTTRATSVGLRVEMLAVEDGVGLCEFRIGKTARRGGQDRLSAAQPGRRSTSRYRGGEALGLAIATRIAELMGGSVSVAGETSGVPDLRCVVELGVPAGAGPAPEEPRMRDQECLLVSASDALRDALTEQLTAWGVTVIAADSGTEGLAQIDQDDDDDRIGVVIMDARLPDDELRGLLLLSGWRGAVVAPLVSTGDTYGDCPVIARPATASRLRTAFIRALDGGGTHTTDISMDARLSRSPNAALHHVLVGDDSAVVLRVTQQMLENLGYPADGVQRGADVLAEVPGGRYDALVLDVNLPDMSALDVIRQIRAVNGPAGEIAIVAVGTHVDAEAVREAVAAGADVFAHKPVGVEELRGALESALETRTPARRPVRDHGTSSVP